MIVLTIFPWQDQFKVSIEGADWTPELVAGLSHHLNPKQASAATSADTEPQTSQIVGALKSENA